MKKEDLELLKKQIEELSDDEKNDRNFYLRGIAEGRIQGPPVGYASIDKPWLQNYDICKVNMPLPKQTMYQHIYERNKYNLEFCALNYFGRKIKYKELFKKINEAANAFIKLGIKMGDVVSFCMPTTPETIYAIYALNKIGAICNMIDLTTNDESILTRINNTNSEYLIMMDSLKGKIDNIINDSTLKKVISVSPTNSLPKIVNTIIAMKTGEKKEQLSGKYIDWNDFINNGKSKTNNYETSYIPNMPALIVYTGGTTGMPKGAMLSNDGINATIMQLKDTGISSKPGDRYLDIMPPFIAYGVVCGIHNPLSERQEIVIIPKFEPQKFAGYIKKYKPNHVIGVPALFETMTKSKILKNENLSFLQNMICGGDKLTIASEKRINEFLEKHHSKAKVAQGFGMTEVGTSVTYTINNKVNHENNHIGCPLSKTNIQIINPETNEELTYNQIGEICINTPSKMLGYYNNDEETKKVIKRHSDGSLWIHSGDLGYITNDGELYFIDRMKRMLIRQDGHNVWPGNIEQVISSHYAVDNCVVIGLPGENNTNGVIPTAVIVLKDEYKNRSEELIKEIDEYCLRQMPERDKAQAYIIRNSLPKTNVGKVDFRKVEEEEKVKVKKLVR